MFKRSLLFVCCFIVALNISAQELLILFESTDRTEISTMPPEMAEAVFVSNSKDLIITSSNKSIDDFSGPEDIGDGQYRYLVKLHLMEGHNVRHFYIQKNNTPFRTSTKQKVFFKPGERHYFEVIDPEVKFTLGRDKDGFHLVEGESCVEITSSLPNLIVSPNAQLSCVITSSSTEIGTFVHTVVINIRKLDSLRAVYENIPEQLAEITNIPVFFSNSNIAYINVENISQRIKQRYSVLTIQLSNKSATDLSSAQVQTNITKATEGQSYYNINYTTEKGTVILLDGNIVKKDKQQQIRVPSGVHLLEVYWDDNRQYGQLVQVEIKEEDVTADLSLAGVLSFSYPANATFEIKPCENAMVPSVKKLCTGENTSVLGDYDVLVKKKGYMPKHYTFNVGVRDSIVGFVAVLNCKADDYYRQHIYDKAFKAYQKMAEEDSQDDHVLYQLGECLYNGYGVGSDKTTALELWKEAAELGNMQAVERLIIENIPTGQKKKYLLYAAERGVPDAQMELADLFFYDTELQDYHQALVWYRKACQNIPTAYYQIGEIYHNGLGVTKNINIAKSQYELGRQAGDERCTERLADYLYDEGKIESAVAFYSKLTKPSAISCYRIASSYFDKKVFWDAAHWLLKANTNDLPHTEEQGRFYCLVANHLYEQDKKLSVNLYEIAVDQLGYQKFPKAFFRIGRYYENTIPRTAYQYLSQSAELGDAEAMCRVGYCHEVGLGVRTDYQKAVQWYQKAIDSGYKKAYRFLGTLYINGNGVPKNEKTAVKYWTIAADDGDNGAVKLLVQYYNKKNQTKQAREWERKLK